MNTAFITVTAVAAVVAAVAAFVATRRVGFERAVGREILALEASVGSGERASEVITESQIADLPAPVRRYLRFSGVVGRAPILRAHLQQSGAFRLEPGGRWMDLRAHQHVTTRPPRFLWDATIDYLPVVSFRVRDRYLHGDSQMLGALGGAFAVVDESGAEIDLGSWVRYLGEAPWYPSVFLDDDVQWEAIDDHAARLRSERESETVEAVCHFREDGALERIVARRYFERDGEYVKAQWTGHHDDYVEHDGFRIPTTSRAVWNLEDGDFEYVRLTVEEADFRVGAGTGKEGG